MLIFLAELNGLPLWATNIQQSTYQWESVYGHLDKPKPTNAPSPLGKPVQLTHYVDANLMHDIMTGKSMAACLHFFNATPGEWYSKKMATVETATYGAEFVAARTCVEQIIDLQNTFKVPGGSGYGDKLHVWG